ncbi:MAG TPA: hypothetical protein VHZ03_36935 [Trebonia sp.]|nr:hypothetical protein [Trebonia sp.]
MPPLVLAALRFLRAADQGKPGRQDERGDDGMEQHEGDRSGAGTGPGDLP